MKFFSLALLLTGFIMRGAEPDQLSPLAVTLSPPCSARPGVRTLRSSLVQLQLVTAWLSAQSSRSADICRHSAALWVTQSEVSQQIDLGDASTTTFGIVDVTPDGSKVLLAKWETQLGLKADSHAAIASVSLTDAAVEWKPLTQLAEPPGKPAAQVIAGPIRSCRTDPDVAGACYQARARLSDGPDGDSKLLWPVGGTHIFSVDEQAIPTVLSSAVKPGTRVYATMLICPVIADHPTNRRPVCIESATDLKLEAVPKASPLAAPQ